MAPGAKSVLLSANTSWYLFNFRAATIRALVQAGYDVTCLAPEDDYSQRLAAIPGCSWVPLAMDNQGSNPFREAALFLRFCRVYNRLRPVAACHFTIKNNVYGTWAAALHGIPAINNIPGLGASFGSDRLVPRVGRLLYRYSQRFAHKVFCQNPQDLRVLVTSGIAPRDKLQLLPGSGVDTRRFQPATRHHRSGEFRFLFAGRMLRDKGLPELRRAMELVRAGGARCKLWLSGFSDVASATALSGRELREWALDPDIEWLGPCDTMESIYSQVDCVVLPSYYREGTPRSLLEAGAMGLPVITTDTPGCSDLVRDGVNGLICSARSAESLADAMLRMMALPQQERQDMGRRGREHVVANYREDTVVQATLDAIEQAMADNDARKLHY